MPLLSCRHPASKQRSPKTSASRSWIYAFRHLSVRVDFIVFRTDTEPDRIEDEGRTLSTHVLNLPKKVYAKLDDFGDPADWNQIYDKKVCTTLRESGIGQYVETFMLAEEY